MIENHLNSFAAGALFRNTQRVGRNSERVARMRAPLAIAPYGLREDKTDRSMPGFRGTAGKSTRSAISGHFIAPGTPLFATGPSWSEFRTTRKIATLPLKFGFIQEARKKPVQSGGRDQ